MFKACQDTAFGMLGEFVHLFPHLRGTVRASLSFSPGLLRQYMGPSVGQTELCFVTSSMKKKIWGLAPLPQWPGASVLLHLSPPPLPAASLSFSVHSWWITLSSSDGLWKCWRHSVLPESRRTRHCSCCSSASAWPGALPRVTCLTSVLLLVWSWPFLGLCSLPWHF